MADVGQEEDFEAAKEKALKIGATKCYVEDIRREVRDQRYDGRMAGNQKKVTHTLT